MKKIAITQQDPGTGGVDSLTGFNLESLSTYREAFVLTQKSNIEYCFLLNSYITVEVSHPCNFFDKMIEKSLIGIYYITLKVPSTVMHFNCFIQASLDRYMT